MILRFLRKSDQSLASGAALRNIPDETVSYHVSKKIGVDIQKTGANRGQVNVIMTNIATKPCGETVFSKFINAISCSATSNTHPCLSKSPGKTYKN